MGMLDFMTAGKNDDATNALDRAYGAYAQVAAPTEAQLTLPQLEKFIQEGLISPEQAQAVLQKQNAYDDITVDPRAREASMDALMKLQEIGDSGGHDAAHEAATYDAMSKANQHTQSTRASILDQMAQRGIPASLMGVTSQLAAAGQDAEQAHKDQLQANADAQNRALAAMEASGTMGTQIHGQQFGEAAQKASAQNAIDQWNAANQTTVNLNNAAARERTAVNNQNVKQAVSNANVAADNTRTQYNSALPQQVYSDRLAKASGEAGIAKNQADQLQKQGEQNAGLYSSLIGAGMTMIGGPAAGAAAGAITSPKASSPTASNYSTGYDNGSTMNAAHGGVVPGHAGHPGDNPGNDTVPAMLSPGEVVVPRTVAGHPDAAANFIRHLNRSGAVRPVHHEDVRAVLDALTNRRHGGQ